MANGKEKKGMMAVKKQLKKPSGEAKQPTSGPYSKDAIKARQAAAKKRAMDRSDAPFKRSKVMAAGGHEGTIESPMKKYIGFNKLSSKIQGEGKSKEAADAIAASIGRKKYGAKKFNKAAGEGKKLG